MRHGSNLDPPNRFESVHAERDLEHVEWDQEYLHGLDNRKIEYQFDTSKSIISTNDSPDVPFDLSINPYRGCIHGCSYCYARPGHEYLGMNAGLDFETKIVVKRDAAKLFKEYLAQGSYVPKTIVFSGVTDCYQPAEREFRLTRACLEVALECRQPVGIITKNALVLRDLDVMSDLANMGLIHVAISVTTLDAKLAREMEPRTSVPAARLRAIQALSEAGVPTGVMVAPIIPGLNDNEVPQILEAARDAGARTAGSVLLRLPLSVSPVFEEWITRTQPLKAEMVLNRLRSMRGGKDNVSTFGERMVGTGTIAEQIQQMVQMFRKKFGLDGKLPKQRCDLFTPPTPKSGQMRLF